MGGAFTEEGSSQTISSSSVSWCSVLNLHFRLSLLFGKVNTDKLLLKGKEAVVPGKDTDYSQFTCNSRTFFD